MQLERQVWLSKEGFNLLEAKCFHLRGDYWVWSSSFCFLGFILSFFSFYFISWNDEYNGCEYWKVICLIGFIFSSFMDFHLLLFYFVFGCLIRCFFFCLICCLVFFSSLIWFDFVLFRYFPLFVTHWLNHDIRFIWIWNPWFSFHSSFKYVFFYLNSFWKLCYWF